MYILVNLFIVFDFTLSTFDNSVVLLFRKPNPAKMKLKKLEPVQKITEDTTTDADKTEEEVGAAATACFVHSVAKMDIP